MSRLKLAGLKPMLQSRAVEPPCVFVMHEDPGIVELICTVLEAHAFRTAGTSILNSRPRPPKGLHFDLFILDLGWDGHTRLDLVERLRAEGHPDTPAIGMSAWEMRCREARESGLFADTIDVPFGIPELLEKVERLTGWQAPPLEEGR